MQSLLSAATRPRHADLAAAAVGSSGEAMVTGLIEDAAWGRLPGVPTDLTLWDEGTVTFRALKCPSGGGAVTPLSLARTVYGEDYLAGTVYELSETDLEVISEQCTPTWRPYSLSWVGRSNEE
jgi:hypothetical protein